MPRIKKVNFERLQRAGQRMSNLCYNLAQGRRADAESSLMREAFQEWDAAKEAIRQEFIVREKEQKG